MSVCGLVSMSPVSMDTRREPQKPGDAVRGSCELSNVGWELNYFSTLPHMYHITKPFFKNMLGCSNKIFIFICLSFI